LLVGFVYFYKKPAAGFIGVRLSYYDDGRSFADFVRYILETAKANEFKHYQKFAVSIAVTDNKSTNGKERRRIASSVKCELFSGFDNFDSPAVNVVFEEETHIK